MNEAPNLKAMLKAMTAIEKKRARQNESRVPSEGPPGYPLVGHLHLFRSRAHPTLFQMLTDWADTYGSIYPLRLGPKKVYILNGYDCISELFNNPAVDGRTSSKTFVDALGEGTGPASAQGKAWSCQRHYAVKYFSNATEFMARAVIDEMKEIVAALSDKSRRSFDIQQDFYRPALYNILCKVTFGKRFDFEDEDFKVFADALDTVFDDTGPATLHYTVSLPFGPSKKIRNKVMQLKPLFEKLIRERREYLAGKTSTASCYVDGYLLMQQTNNGAATHHFTDANLVWAIFEMCIGGTNVPKNALSAILVYLINNPEVQAKCQAELDTVLGGRTPSYEDRHRLPYTQATIAECMRMGNVTPLAVPRVVTKSVSFGDYVFPPGTVFMSNLHSFMMDPTTFPEPDKFNPERFLDAEGHYQRPKELAPFGVGMRSCLGENLAWMEFFLITCGILQKMSLSTPKGEDSPIVTTGTTGVARSPLPFRVQVQER